jgi:hypothetical protein
MRLNFQQIFLVVIASGCFFSAAAQEKVDTQSVQDKVDPKIEKVRYFGSFTTLPFENSVGKVEKGKTVEIGGIKIITKIHQLRKPIFVSTELCSSTEKNGSLTPIFIDEEFFRVKEFVSYEFANRIFAYEINYEFFDGETGLEIGATTAEFYVDKSGDGVFALDCGVKDFRLDALPKWVKVLQK